MEDDNFNGRHPQYKTTSMEDYCEGRQTQWKMTSLQDDINGIRPHHKMTLLENDLIEQRRQVCITTAKNAFKKIIFPTFHSMTRPIPQATSGPVFADCPV